MGDYGESCLDYLWGGWAVTGDSGSTDVPRILGFIEAPNIMHGLLIVPHREVIRWPVVHLDGMPSNQTGRVFS